MLGYAIVVKTKSMKTGRGREGNRLRGFCLASREKREIGSVFHAREVHFFRLCIGPLKP